MLHRKHSKVTYSKVLYHGKSVEQIVYVLQCASHSHCYPKREVHESKHRAALRKRLGIAQKHPQVR
jgi:hypothetical protein